MQKYYANRLKDHTYIFQLRTEKYEYEFTGSYMLKMGQFITRCLALIPKIEAGLINNEGIDEICGLLCTKTKR